MPRARIETPGRLALTLLSFRRNKTLTLAGSVFFLIGSVFAIAPWGMLARDTRIAAEGHRTTATVTHHSVTEDGEGYDEYNVHYAFVTRAGETIRDGMFNVPRETYRAVRDGDHLSVVYDPARPSDSFADGNGLAGEGGMQSPWTAAAFSLFGALFAAFGGIFPWGILVRGPGIWSRLFAEGRETEGTVTEIERGTDSDGDPIEQYRLHFTFRDRFGAMHDDQTEWGPKALTDGWAPGDSGTVLHGRRDPSTTLWLGRGDLDYVR